MEVTLAIFSSFCFGIAMVLARVGLRSSSMLSGLLINQTFLFFSSLVIALVAAPLDHFKSSAVIYFMLSGFLGTCLGQVLLFTGIHRVGSSIAAPLYDLKPLFSTFGAMVLLGEELTVSIGLATIVIIIGSAIISLEESGGKIETKWTRKDLIFPILAGASFGISNVIRKMGLNIIPDPILGSAYQNVPAFVFFSLYAVARGTPQTLDFKNRRVLTFFILCGIANLIGQLALYIALVMGRVVIVSPLSSTSPVFVLILAALFLKKIERVTLKIWLGTLCIIGGVVMLTLARTG